MSDNELRDRIAEAMRRAEGEWWRTENVETDVDSHVAQAVIDDLGLTVQMRSFEKVEKPVFYEQYPVIAPGLGVESRVVGRWEPVE